MSASTDTASLAPTASTRPQLRHGTLSSIENFGQSIANIAPTLTPALNIAVVAGIAGIGSWLTFVIATIGLLFVGANVGTLARRHPMSGSFFVYIGRTFGPLSGAVSGWAMIAAYLFTAVAVNLGLVIFMDNVCDAIGLGAKPPHAATAIVFSAAIWYAGFRDIKLSSRIGLLLEAISISIIIAITAIVVVQHGTIVDPVQLDPAQIKMGPVMKAMAFAVFCYVGFESAATLAKETHDAGRTVPRSIIMSAAAVGIFFTIITYCMVMGMNDDAGAIGGSGAPFSDMTAKAGLPWAAGVVYFSALISGFACGLASVNAASRLIFSMGRYKLFHSSMGGVHAEHGTPHFAITLSCVFSIVVTLVMLSQFAALDAFGYAGTFATFGFLVVYLGICIAAPVDLKRSGLMRPIHVVSGVVGAVMMVFVIGGSLYPMPDYPYNLIPYIFAGYLAVGAIYFAVLGKRDPAGLATIEHDLEM